MSRQRRVGPFDRDLLPEPVAYFEAQGLSLEGRGRWRTGACPFHGGSDSLRVNVESGGWACMACGEHGGDVLTFHMLLTGMTFQQAASVLGAWDDSRGGYCRGHRMPLPAADLLRIFHPEMLVVVVVACDMFKRRVISNQDFDRLLLACSRLQKICAL